jgi:hypothetical protein
MARRASSQAAPVAGHANLRQPLCGTVRSCVPYAGELARHRVISADGGDYVVATLHEPHRGPAYLTGAYPVVRGYLVMVRQPLFEVRSGATESARREHEQLVRVLAEAGAKLVRARRALAARQRAERGQKPGQPAVRSARDTRDDAAAFQAAPSIQPAAPSAMVPDLAAADDTTTAAAFG